MEGIEIILSEKSHAPNDPEIFRRNGIEPTDKKILVLKSRGHFRAAYEPFSKLILEVDAPRLTTPNLHRFDHKISQDLFGPLIKCEVFLFIFARYKYTIDELWLKNILALADGQQERIQKKNY